MSTDSTTESVLRYERRDRAAWLTLDRPAAMNALNYALRTQLVAAIDTAVADPEVKVLVLTGNGRAFSAGADVIESAKDRPTTAMGWREALEPYIEETLKIYRCPKPVIGAINGYALGAGCDLALATDVTIASSSAKFGEPEISFYSAPSTMLLPWIIGMKQAKELLLTGRIIDAAEAERIGMINRVVAPDELEAAATELAAELARVPGPALQLNKVGINATYEAQGLLEALRYNLETSIQTYLAEPSADRAARLHFIQERGLRAFHELGYDAAVAEGHALLDGSADDA